MASGQKISVNNLQVGMHVTSLDRPWLETPFLLQGFIIREQDEIELLNKYCEYVYIEEGFTPKAVPQQRKPIGQVRKPREEVLAGRTLQVYKDLSPWSEEYPNARAAVADLSQGVDRVFANVRQGSALNMVEVRAAVQPMISSITRNPDACIWLARMKQVGDYNYQHALGTSIWAVALGRHLGLPSQDLRSLAIGGILMDVGKLQIDADLLNSKRRLTPEEFQRVKKHVAAGVSAYESTVNTSQDVLDMIAHHHERADASGYPQGLRGEKIPVFGRIAGIVDTYDAMTSQRSYASAVTPADAIKHLYERRGKDFQTELVEEFIQAIGIYPAGTLVELTSGEVAIIVAEYRTRRLRPRVLVLLDASKQPLEKGRVVDLLTETHTPTGEPLDIVESRNPEDFGIDLSGIAL